MVNGESIKFKTETGGSKMATQKFADNQKVVVNPHSIVVFVKEGSLGSLQSLRLLFDATIARLGLDSTKGRILRKIPRNKGTDRPGLADIKRWLEALDGSDKYAEDRKLLLSLNKTLVTRIQG